MMENLDGNAAGGMLEAIFPFEMTMAEGTCAGCGEHYVMGATAVNKHAMGTIIRCPRCDTVLVRVAEIRGRYWLDLRGMRVLQLPAK
jgi:predicted SprT family Zn-dependent metalloprotease